MPQLGAAYVAIKGDTKPLKKDLHTAKTLTASAVGTMTQTVGKLSVAMAQAGVAAAAIGTAFAAWKAADFVRGVVSVGSSFEDLRTQLETITKGRGVETLERLNKWALRMPVDTRQAVEAFKNMAAMGLEPTIAQMTTLVDTMSAVGGGTETLMGIARALGQIATKGKPSMEELLQLAERGVPVFQILQEELNMTGQEVAEIAKSGKSATEVINALFAGMQERFGGASEKMQEKWSGMITTLKSYWVEFQRLIAESGIFQHLKDRLGELLATVDKLSAEGKLKEWAVQISDSMIRAEEAIVEFVGDIKGLIGYLKELNTELAIAKEGFDILITPIKPLIWFMKGLGKEIGVMAGKYAELREEARTTAQTAKDLRREVEKPAESGLSFDDALAMVKKAGKAHDELKRKVETPIKAKADATQPKQEIADTGQKATVLRETVESPMIATADYSQVRGEIAATAATAAAAATQSVGGGGGQDRSRRLMGTVAYEDIDTVMKNVIDNIAGSGIGKVSRAWSRKSEPPIP